MMLSIICGCGKMLWYEGNKRGTKGKDKEESIKDAGNRHWVEEHLAHYGRKGRNRKK